MTQIITNDIVNKYSEYSRLLKEKYYDYIPDAFINTIYSDFIDNGIFPRSPLTITWDITDYCNLSCYFCSAKLDDGKCRTDLGPSELMSIANKIVNENVIKVIIQGGEPFCVKNLLDIIDILVINGIFVELITNGTLINDKDINKMKKYDKNLFRLKISLDAPDRYINDKIRGKGSYDKVIDLIRKLSNQNISVRVQSVITEENQDKVEEMYELVNSLNVESYGFTVLLKVGKAKNITEKIDMNKLLEQSIAILKKEDVITKFEKNNLGYIQNIEDIDKCMSNSNIDKEKIFIQKCDGAKIRMEIDANGDVYPCAFLRVKEFLGGNILNNELREQWNSKNFINFRYLTREKKDICSKCNLEWCNTGCSALAYHESGDVRKCDPNCMYHYNKVI